MPFPSDDELQEEEMEELSALAELSAEDLDEELESAQDELLQGLRELIADYLSGEESAEDTKADLKEDLIEWDLECLNNPYLPDFPDLAAHWGEATETISEGYNLMLMGVDRNQEDYMQAGLEMVEDGLLRRDSILRDE